METPENITPVSNGSDSKEVQTPKDPPSKPPKEQAKKVGENLKKTEEKSILSDPDKLSYNRQAFLRFNRFKIGDVFARKKH